MNPEQTKNLKAQIHIGKAQLSMDDEVYRALLERVTGKKSTLAMSLRELISVRDELKKLGFKVVSSKHTAPKVAADKADLVGKIGALLADAGLPWSYLTAKTEKSRTKASDRPMSMLERITGKGDDGRTVGKERIEFCSVTDLRKIVAALTYQAQRRAQKEAAEAVQA